MFRNNEFLGAVRILVFSYNQYIRDTDPKRGRNFFLDNPPGLCYAVRYREFSSEKEVISMKNNKAMYALSYGLFVLTSICILA